MSRTIFISWSGWESHAIALAFRDLILAVLGDVETFVSSQDIAKGSRWNEELNAVLNRTGFGILCVIPHNAEKPWLNFEAGALSVSVQRNQGTAWVAPFLVDVDPARLPATLAQFNSTRFDRGDVLRLLAQLNRITGEREASQLQSRLDGAWLEFEQRVKDRARDGDPVQRPLGASGPPELPEEAVKMLRYLAVATQAQRSVRSVARQLELSELRVRALLSLLRGSQLVADSLEGCFVSGIGLRYLHERGLA